jgi:excisionase family DNA binding protein
MSRSHLDALFADRPSRLSVAEVADLLGVSDQTVYQWLNKGALPGYQIGRTWIVLRDDVKAALTAGSNAAARLVDETEEDDTPPPTPTGS